MFVAVDVPFDCKIATASTNKSNLCADMRSNESKRRHNKTENDKWIVLQAHHTCILSTQRRINETRQYGRCGRMSIAIIGRPTLNRHPEIIQIRKLEITAANNDRKKADQIDATLFIAEALNFPCFSESIMWKTK